MNVSGMDAYNLAWKICSVVAGQSKPEILSTYQTERHPVACELISVDHQFAEFYSRKIDLEASDDDIRKDNQRFRNEFYDFMSGIAVQYETSSLVVDSKQHLASNIILADGYHLIASSIKQKSGQSICTTCSSHQVTGDCSCLRAT
jgi:phenol 2-monooxygenase